MHSWMSKDTFEWIAVSGIVIEIIVTQATKNLLVSGP